MSEKRKIVAVGPAEELLCLKSAGVEFVELDAEGDLGAALRKQAQDPSVGLILVSEAVAGPQFSVVGQVRRQTDAVLMVVPGYRGSQGTTLEHMKHALEQSIGVDLISKS
jgi:vacuolar-type H+-ATPase subunit F/Vma7